MRNKATGAAIDPKLIAAVKKYEDAARKTGLGSFTANQVGGKVIDSDSELGESSDDADKFEREPAEISNGLP